MLPSHNEKFLQSVLCFRPCVLTVTLPAFYVYCIRTSCVAASQPHRQISLSCACTVDNGHSPELIRHFVFSNRKLRRLLLGPLAVARYLCDLCSLQCADSIGPDDSASNAPLRRRSRGLSPGELRQTAALNASRDR